MEPLTQTQAIRSVAILFALPEEAKPFLAQHRTTGNVATAVCGVGKTNAAQTTETLLADGKFHCLIICGFAGGLTNDLQPGSLVLADTVTDGERNFQPDSALLSIAESVSIPDVAKRTGTLFTGGRVLVTSTEKHDLAQRTGAVAVDMETAGAVRIAQAKNIPWLAVRVVTDGVNDDLPLNFNAFANPDGSVNHGRIIRATLASPRKIPALIRLGKRSSLAASHLALFLNAFLNKLPETF